MPPHHAKNHDHEHTEIAASELKDYIKHNIRHLEDHIKSFTKLRTKLDDSHLIESLESAITYLTKGLDELKHLFEHM